MYEYQNYIIRTTFCPFRTVTKSCPVETVPVCPVQIRAHRHISVYIDSNHNHDKIKKRENAESTLKNYHKINSQWFYSSSSCPYHKKIIGNIMDVTYFYRQKEISTKQFVFLRFTSIVCTWKVNILLFNMGELTWSMGHKV